MRVEEEHPTVNSASATNPANLILRMPGVPM
jgi:hypothetical protein